MDHEAWRDRQRTVRVESGYHEFEWAYVESDGEGPPTVFLHGIPTWSFLWREVYDAVDHAIVPDLPGYGFTYHTGSGEFDRSVAAQEAYLEDFLDELGYDSVRLVAHDIGGAVALRLAVHTDRVERLVLSNCVCYDSWPVEDVISLSSPADARTQTYQGMETYLRESYHGDWGTYDPERTTEEFVDGMVAPYVNPERDPGFMYRSAIATNTNHTLEITPHLGSIEAPTLLLWGLPGQRQHVEYAKRLAEDIPDAETEYFSPAYHWVMQDCPGDYREGLAGFLE